MSFYIITKGEGEGKRVRIISNKGKDKSVVCSEDGCYYFVNNKNLSFQIPSHNKDYVKDGDKK